MLLFRDYSNRRRDDFQWIVDGVGGWRCGKEFDAEMHVFVLAAEYLESDVHGGLFSCFVHVRGPDNGIRFHALNFPLWSAIV